MYSVTLHRNDCLYELPGRSTQRQDLIRDLAHVILARDHFAREAGGRLFAIRLAL
jgi:hypothetical protein